MLVRLAEAVGLMHWARRGARLRGLHRLQVSGLLLHLHLPIGVHQLRHEAAAVMDAEAARRSPAAPRRLGERRWAVAGLAFGVGATAAVVLTWQGRSAWGLEALVLALAGFNGFAKRVSP